MSDAKYKDNSTEFDLHLFDVQLFNTIELSDNTTWPKSITIEGAESGARGITIAAGTASSSITVSNVSGRFLDGEQIIFYVILFVLIFYTHRKNIKRLKNKEESKSKIY